MVYFSTTSRRFLFAALLLIGLASALLVALPAQAQQGTIDQSLPYATATGLATRDLREIAARIIQVALGLLGLVALGIVLYAGFLWMTSSGDEEKITRAKTMLRNGLIGLVLILSAYSITLFVLCGIYKYCPEGFGRFRAAGVGGENPPGGGLLFGVVERYYPTGREIGDAIPGRDTAILVTFRVPMDPTTLTAGLDAAGNPTSADPSTYGVQILRTDDAGKSSPTYLPAQITASADHKTYEISPRPIFPIASTDPTSYTVRLAKSIKKQSGVNAFPDGALPTDLCPAGFGFCWSFNIANRLDTVPPFVTQAFPQVLTSATDCADPEDWDVSIGKCLVPKNQIVQVNFSEALSPLLVREGIVDIVSRPRSDPAQGTRPVEGTWQLTNGYRTLEFTPSSKCGVNSCGEDIYCLPKDADVTVRVQTATLETDAAKKTEGKDFQAAAPADGMTDLANNALDGNYDGLTHVADGKTTDYFELAFATGNRVDTVPPEMRYLSASSADPSTLFSVQQPIWDQFQKPLMTTSLTADQPGYPGTIAITAFTKAGVALPFIYNPWFAVDAYATKTSLRGRTTPISPAESPQLAHDCVTDCQPSEGEAQSGYQTLLHYPLWDAALLPNVQYRINTTSAVRDLTQNCFQPSVCQGKTCTNELEGVCAASGDETRCAPPSVGD